MHKEWQVVQKFKHRGMYDMNEIDHVVHQDGDCFDDKHEVQLVDGD
jgi:hypothetical protein